MFWPRILPTNRRKTRIGEEFEETRPKRDIKPPSWMKDYVSQSNGSKPSSSEPTANLQRSEMVIPQAAIGTIKGATSAETSHSQSVRHGEQHRCSSSDDGARNGTGGRNATPTIPPAPKAQPANDNPSQARAQYANEGQRRGMERWLRKRQERAQQQATTQRGHRAEQAAAGETKTAPRRRKRRPRHNRQPAGRVVWTEPSGHTVTWNMMAGPPPNAKQHR
ncbi:unnamed protein product [Nesidiocoris tenuis]|uniref:Uncharacterized protein n=1 Tax=Nesidiocoris tenuis TaxID=355587 RepID=A0A6H5G6X8_9HEMI|nr:unnamed protein product [Nesidiocoris tenuis]